MTWRIPTVALVLALTGCGASEPPSSPAPEPSHEPGDTPGATRASREAQQEPASDDVASAPAVDHPLLTLREVDVASAEDGRGELVPATRPIAFELDARRFPPRALDPVLEVGELRLRHYDHPAPGVLRFVLADRALAEGALIAVSYAGDPQSRVIVSPVLSLDVVGTARQVRP